MIPKNIFYTHTSQYRLPRKLRYCIFKTRELHPDWNFHFFSDGDCEDFVKQECPEFSELYDWFPRPVMKADLFRLLVVMRRGGFYLDTDFLVRTSLDPLCVHKCVFSYEHALNTTEFNLRFPRRMRTKEEPLTLANYAFGAEANDPFINSITDEIINRTRTIEQEKISDLDVLHSTGPDVVTTVYYRDLSKWGHVEVLSASHAELGEYGMFGDYGTHLVSGSWRES